MGRRIPELELSGVAHQQVLSKVANEHHHDYSKWETICVRQMPDSKIFWKHVLIFVSIHDDLALVHAANAVLVNKSICLFLQRPD